MGQGPHPKASGFRIAGHQAIGLAFGAEISQSPEIIHGKDCLIFRTRSRGIVQSKRDSEGICKVKNARE